MEGYKTYRHSSNPKEKELHDKFKEQFIDCEDRTGNEKNFINKIVFGCSDAAQAIPNDTLSDREKKIVLSTIQWLGSPVGQSFLRDCDIECTDNRS